MNKSELELILQEGEGYRIEFKESLPANIDKDLIAFANSSGGRIFLGITDDKVIKGVKITNTLKTQIQDMANNCQPPVKIILEAYEDVLIINVREGADKPYKCSQGFYTRVGDEDRKLTAKELENIILRKNKDKLRWDTQACKEARLSDISSAKLKVFLKGAGLRYDNLRNALAKLKLITDGKLLNAAEILFGKEPQSFFPNAKLRCAVFGTADTAYPIDMQGMEGDLFYLIEQAQAYILKNIHIGMKLDGLRRIDVPEIDKEAFREAIINAFCHRDYDEYDSVNIAIFTDRVEIRSPGLIYGGLTIAQIKKEMVSERRNELIAELLHRVHFIEKWGRGIKLILSKEPDTDFKEVGTHFITVFKRKGGTKSEGVNEGLNERQKKAIDYIKQNGRITSGKYREVSGIGKVYSVAELNDLVKRKILTRKGSGRAVYYTLVND